MNIKGIKKRWVFNSLGATIGIFALIIISFLVIVRGYFYSGIRQTLLARSNELYSIFKGCLSQNDLKFEDIAKIYVDNFSDDDVMDLFIINSKGDVIMSSSGFLPNKFETMPDYIQAKQSESGLGIWEGRSFFDEKIMAVTKCIYNENSEYIGAIRYIVSMEEANSRIIWSSLILTIIGALIVLFMGISGIYFIKSIVNPINDVCVKAKRIAKGDFHIKIEKKYDDEIGELIDIINYMAQELDASEKLKNEFISSISHELRTPLTAIKGWAETMQYCETTDETIKKGTVIIAKEATRLSGIVEELLDFSGIRDKRMSLIKEKIDVLAELGEAVYMFKDRAKEENKALIYNEPKSLLPVMGDKNRLRQVFINIIDNALKYTSDGGGVSVTAGENESMVYITVTDNGCGIPAEHLPNVTKKFYKANYLKRGSGIGLAIVDEIVALHGGKLNIISEESFGTTVTIELPIYNED